MGVYKLDFIVFSQIIHIVIKSFVQSLRSLFVTTGLSSGQMPYVG